jgi:hypothetical protein
MGARHKAQQPNNLRMLLKTYVQLLPWTRTPALCNVSWTNQNTRELRAQYVLLVVRNSLAQRPEIRSAATANKRMKQNKQPVACHIHSPRI